MTCSTCKLVAAAAIIALFAFSTVGLAQPADSEKPFTPPTLAILNGKVWTGSAAMPEAEAVAITGQTITAVGTTDEIKALAGAGTRVIDAKGRRVIPGLVDCHTHIINMGLHISRLDLRTARDKGHFIELITTAAPKLAPGQWLLGGQYTVESWPEPESPRKEWIDEATPGTPVFLTRMDGHQALVNSIALRFARITREGPPDPPGGEIERDPETGEPTGILKDDAMSLVGKFIPPTSKEQLYDALTMAMKVAAMWGVTAIHDMSERSHLEIFKAAADRDALTFRVTSYVESSNFKRAWPIIEPFRKGDDLFRVAGFKAFMDGSLGSRTAYMREPFDDAAPDAKYPRGLRSGHASDLEKFAAEVKWAHEQGAQMAIHAIGDQAIHELLDIYAQLPDTKARRHRVEHTQHLLAEDIGRFAELGVTASMQPFHKADDGRWAEKALGSVRSRTSYAFRSLLEAGANVAFGSDCPVVTLNPFSGIETAVSSMTLDGVVWVPQQAISREQALSCYTLGAARAAHMEDRVGTIETGKLADIVILDQDILSIPADRIHETESYVTIVSGNVVWKNDALTGP